MASANLFQQYLQPVRSVQDYASDMDKAEGMQLALQGQRRQNELAALTADQTRETLAQSAAKRNALQAIYANPSAADPIAREKLMLSNPLLSSDGQAAQKARLDAENTQAQARERGAAADKTSFQLQVEKANKAISDITSLGSPQDALASLEAHRKAGDLDEQKYQGVLATLQPAVQNPALFGKWQRDMVLNIMDAKDKIAATAAKPTEVRLGNRVVMIDTNPNSPTYKQEVTSANIGVSPDTMANNAVQIRDQNLRDSRAREGNALKAAEIQAGGKPPPGYRWTAEGALEAIPGGPGDKLPESQQKQVVGTQNLSNAIREYRDSLKSFGALDALKPDQRAMMGTKYNNMMLQAKEAYNLGVLNGPDFDILQSVVTDPRSLKGVITSNKALDTQASELDRIMSGVAKTSSQLKPRGSGAQQAAKKPAMSPQDEQAAQWANANPNDPRAAKIKQRLGL